MVRDDYNDMRYFKPVEDTSSSGSANGNEGADKEPTHMGEVHQAAKVWLCVPYCPYNF